MTQPRRPGSTYEMDLGDYAYGYGYLRSFIDEMVYMMFSDTSDEELRDYTASRLARVMEHLRQLENGQPLVVADKPQTETGTDT